MAKNKKRADHRADTRGKALSGLPHIVADSAAYLALSPFDRAVLGEILRKFNGYNNGAIVISYGQIGERLKGPNSAPPNNGRIGRAIGKLMAHGLVAEPTPASWLERRAREYRLTFISSGKNPPFRSATNEYLSWRAPEQKKRNAASPTKHLSGDAQSPGPPAVGDPASSAESKIRSFASSADDCPGDAGSSLIVKPYPAASKTSGATVIPITRSGTG